MDGEGKNTPSRLNRRELLKTTAAGGAALAAAKITPAAAAPGRRQAPAVLGRQGGKLVIAMTNADQQLAQPLIDEYAQTKGIEIEVQGFPFEGLLEKLTINLTQATGAYDVVSMDDPWIPQFAGGEFLMNLEELGYQKDPDFVPELLALGDFPPGSGQRAIPWVGNVQVFAWRTDVLEEMGIAVPKTWDEVLTAATAITEAKKSQDLYGFGLRGVAGNPAATSFLPILRGHGGDLFDDNNNPKEPTLDTPEAHEALRKHLELAKVAPPGVENVQHADMGTNMYSGRIAMAADIWPDLLLQIWDPKVSKVVGKVAIGPEPAQAGVEPKNMTGNWLLGIPEGSKNAEQALDFIVWITSAEQQKRLLLNNNVPATRTSVLTDAEAVEKLPFLPGLLEAARKAVPRPRTPHYNAAEAIYGRYIAEAIAGQTSPEDALKNANKEIRDLMVREGVIQE
ncbi:MAG: ABC transporter substrate-binding protein [Thermomicrobiales bacterium]|nr:MAG: ABC transporter substrate-binding protein [Thermomicrobiales bacterium]